MSPYLPTVSGTEVIQALRKKGFHIISQKGSHVKLTNDQGRKVIVPLHKSVARGTLNSILNQAGLTQKEFKDLL